MPDRHAKVIIDTNLWISFLIGLKASPAVRRILTDGTVSIVMTDILQQEIMAVASRPKFASYLVLEQSQQLIFTYWCFTLSGEKKKIHIPGWE